MASWVPPRWLRPVVFVLCLVPAAWVITAIASDYFNGTRLLGSHPIKEAEHFTGRWVLRFLAITLAVTPIRQTLGWNWLQRYRRMFGLYAFTYAALHLTIYFVLDLELIWGDLWADIVKRPYITIGMSAFLLLVPLAVTSTAKMVKRLGGKRWAALHRTMYVIVVLGTIHFWMSVKRDVTDPLVFALIFALLLGYRIVKARRKAALKGTGNREPGTAAAGRQASATGSQFPVPGSPSS
jgi:sulfoxide reductase heme-binding subunit YedZ